MKTTTILGNTTCLPKYGIFHESTKMFLRNYGLRVAILAGVIRAQENASEPKIHDVKVGLVSGNISPPRDVWGTARNIIDLETNNFLP